MGQVSTPEVSTQNFEFEVLPNLLSPAYAAGGKIMFSVVSVCHSVHMGGSSYDHYTECHWSDTSHMGASQISSNLFTMSPVHLSLGGWPLAERFYYFLLFIIVTDRN